MKRKQWTPAYGYPRVSSKGQTRGHGPRRQRDIIKDFAKRNGYEVVGWYPEAYTGTEGDRPAFADMLTAILANGVKVIIVESLDRFARDLMVQNALLAKLASEGITLIAANTGEDVTAAMSDDPMRWALVQIQGIFSELDKRQLVRKLKRARAAKKASTGRCEGALPFGAYEGESETLDRVRQLRRKRKGVKRMSVQRIADQLNAEECHNRSGDPWTRGNLWKVMRTAGIR